MLTPHSARNPCHPSCECNVQSLVEGRIQPVSAILVGGGALLGWDILLDALPVPTPLLLLVQ